MLRISTRGRYATRIMVYLALSDGSAYVQKRQIAEAEQISGDYVEQILTRLKTAQLVTSHRGARGGFTLARRPDAISVNDILAATEGPVCLVTCDDGECTRTSQCPMASVWRKAGDALTKIFSETMLSDLANQARSLRKTKSFVFQI